MKYAIKVLVPDGGWLYVTETKKDGRRDIATYDTFEKAQKINLGVWGNKGEVVEYHENPFGNPEEKVCCDGGGPMTAGCYHDHCTGPVFKKVDKLTDEEIEELRAKKKAIKEELYEAVKMEMFKASSKLEGIDK